MRSPQGLNVYPEWYAIDPDVLAVVGDDDAGVAEDRSGYDVLAVFVRQAERA